jgi:hypothetical protein
MSCPTPPGEIASPAVAAIEFDSSKASAIYANVCRVTATPEEIVLDFALYDGSENESSHRVSRRVAINHFTAKRLFIAMAQALQQHEAAFGAVETSLEKRAVGLKS